MSVYKKLNQARMMVHAQPLKKSGQNKHLGNKYWELSDFLPQCLIACDEVGLCPLISYDREHATMRLVDVDTGEEIVITSPMGSANLKNCHEIQNLGASMTYSDRYLWKTAMQLIEQDILDAVITKDDVDAFEPKKVLANDAQIAELITMIEVTGTDVASLCRFYKVDAIKQLTKEQADHAIASVKKKVSK